MDDGDKQPPEYDVNQVVTYMKHYSLNKNVKDLLKIINPLLAKKESNIRVHFEALRDSLITNEQFKAIEAKIALGKLCLGIEQLIPATRVSILFYAKEENKVYHGAAPNIPVDYFDFFQIINDNNLLNANCASCGKALFTGEIIVTDIATDPLWALFKDHPLRYGFRTCWSVPFFHEDQAIGTFAIYSAVEMKPTKKQIQMIQQRVQFYRDAIFRVSRDIAKKEA